MSPLPYTAPLADRLAEARVLRLSAQLQYWKNRAADPEGNQQLKEFYLVNSEKVAKQIAKLKVRHF